jgi:replicative DNA helicase
MGSPERRRRPDLRLVVPEERFALTGREGDPALGPDDERQPPPHDLDAEGASLSACILDGTPHADGTPCSLERVLEILKPEHYYSAANQLIFEALGDMWAARTPVDVVTLRRWLDDRHLFEKVGGSAYLGLLVDATPAVGHVVTHAEAVLEKWEDRQLIATCQRIAAEGYSPGTALAGAERGGYGVERTPGQNDRDVWRAKARADLGRVTAPRVRLVGEPIDTVVEKTRQRILAIGRGAKVGLPWGFERLKEIGLLGRQRQTILAGRPGMGKTALGFQVCVNIASTPLDDDEIGEAVYVASWEMSPEQLLFRYACSAAYVSVHRVESGKADPDELERVSHKLETVRRLPLIFDHAKCTPRTLAARVRAQKALFEAGAARDRNRVLYPRCRLGLVMVDYAQIVPVDLGPRAQERDIINAASKGLKQDVAEACDVATLVLAMLRRVEPTPDGKVRPPMLDDLKGAGSLEEDADGVFLLHRPSAYMRKKCPPEWRHVAQLIPAKGRYGMPEETPRLGFWGGRFTDQLPEAARGEPHYGAEDDDR